MAEQSESPHQAAESAKFWRSLGKKIAKGPAVRIPSNYDAHRPGPRWRGAHS